MDFKAFYFEDHGRMMAFVDHFWDRVYNVSYEEHDVGQRSGWIVRIKKDSGTTIASILGGK